MPYIKPTIKIYDKTLTLRALIDDYESCSWCRSSYSPTVSTIEINYNIPNAGEFFLGFFVQYGTDIRDFGVITGINDPLGEDGKGSQTRTIKIRDARYLFARRPIMQLNAVDSYSLTGAGETIIKTLISDQCGSTCTDADRIFPLLDIEADSARGSTYAISEKYTSMLDVLITVATQTGISWYVELDAVNKRMILRCSEGTDRSDTVFFSPDYDSVKSAQFDESIDTYSNLVYVAGSGVGTDRDIYEGYTGTEPTGLDRYESYVSASSLTESSELADKAASVLEQYAQTVSVSGSGLTKSPYAYKTDYDVGDIVTVRLEEREAAVKIISITESWSYGKYSIDFEFGRPVLGISEQVTGLLTKVTREDASRESGTNTSGMVSGVLPVSLATGDVTLDGSTTMYNIIEISGVMTANRTLTLSLDTTRLYGRKVYRLYITASGGYNITVKTAVSGKTTAVFSASATPYMADVSIDEEGNATGYGIAGITGLTAALAGKADLSGGLVVNSQLPVPITDSWANYTGLEIPELPDNVAGTTYIQTEWETVDGWANDSGMTVSVEDGKLKVVATVAVACFVYKGSASYQNKNVIAKIKGSVPILTISYKNTATTYINVPIVKINDYECLVSFTFSRSDNNNLVIYLNLADGVSNKTMWIDYIYIGTGANDTLVFDNSYHHRHLINNAVIPTPQGFYFNGETSYLRSRDVITLPDVFTFRATVNCGARSSGQVLCAAGERYDLANGYFMIYRQGTSGSLFIDTPTADNTTVVLTNISNVFFASRNNIDVSVLVTLNFTAKTVRFIGDTIDTTVSVPTLVKPPIARYIWIGNRNLLDLAFRGYMKDVSLHDVALTDANRNWLAQGNKIPSIYDSTNYALFNRTGTYGSLAVGASSTALIPEGDYVLTSSSADVQLQVYDGTSAWVGVSQAVGYVKSDGVNYRVNNINASAQTVYYRRIFA